jgi:beta-carotene hydroxylase
MRCFLRFAALRSLYPLLALVGIWGSCLWGPWLSLPLMFAVLHAASRIECCFGDSPPHLVTSQWCPRFVRHPEDMHVIVFFLLHYLAIASAFWLWQHPDVTGFTDVQSKVGFSLGAGVWLGWSGGINMGINYHSHAHYPLFTNRTANLWFGRLCTLPGGIPAFWWRYKHLVVHHRKLGHREDWVQPHLGSDGRYENIWRYMLLYWPWRWGYHFFQAFRGAGVRVRRTAMKELLLTATLWAIPVVLDPWMALGLWILPAWFGGALIMGSGMYAQHAGGTSVARYSHSTTFLSHFFNLTMFNAGFHIEHTESPGVHWSELPRLHESLKADLIAGSAHVVPFGIYRGASLLTSFVSADAGWQRFGEQHPDYVAEVACGQSAAPIVQQRP